MEISVKIHTPTIERFKSWINLLTPQQWVIVISFIAAAVATYWSVTNGYAVAYGDSESHLNIAKRVVHSLTPGFAQLGGIWLPIPHLLMVPFVYFDFLWRTGLAGSIVSGAAFMISSLYIYKLTYVLTKNKGASFFASMLFVSNPNILYMQSTPMTEMPLICFFLLSSFYFIKFLEDDSELLALLLAGFFGFCATLSRYDGWFLVAFEAGVLGLMYLPWKKIPKKFTQIKEYFDKDRWDQLEGKVVMFITLACFGIGLWFLWDYLILGDPLYFTNSEFSAKTQQNEWDSKGMLPAKFNIWLSFLYYFVTSMSNVGVFVFAVALVGLAKYLIDNPDKRKFFVTLILLVPFVFNVLTLFMGQSIIFIPHLTPVSFEWRLFNVRYGIMMVPTAVFLAGYLFHKNKAQGKLLLVGLAVAQIGLYLVGYSKVMTYADGTIGLSSATAKIPDAQNWISREYDTGLVLVDDYARTLSIIRTRIPMQSIIYIGNRGYWDDSFKAPEKYATWIIMQKNDVLWRKLYENPKMEGRLYKYFNKVYTSPEILVFRRNEAVPVDPADEIPSSVPGYSLQKTVKK